MNYIELTREKLSVEAISNLVVHESCGAISVFAGCTRDNFQDKIVQSLEYEAYEPMAVKHMEMISNSIRERWNDVVNIAMFHRLGLVPVREFSVVIAISSPHRKSSLEAVSYAIDELKKTVPIWKKEKYEGDQSTWKENKESGKCCKRLKLNFPLCAVVEEDNVPRNLIQIAADENEVKRRIQCFIEKKREEIDLNNIMDFTAAKRLSGDEESIEDTSSCARTNSVVVKQEGSKCHLRVSRVKNGIGPQIRPDYLHTLDKLMSANPTTGIAHIKQEPPAELEQEKDSGVRKLPFGFYSRLSDVEEHLNIKAVNTKQIHERLKAIEDRLLHLESISPEYKHFLRLPSSRSSSPQRTVLTKLETKCPPEKKIYSVNELDAIIEKMKQSNA